MSIYVPGTGFPAFKKQVLDRLSVLSAGPNELEMFLFSSRLRLPREAVEKFCKFISKLAPALIRKGSY